MSGDGVPAISSNPNPAPPGVTLVPTMEVQGPAGRVTINVNEKDEWLGRGYKEIAPAPASEPAPSTGGEGGGSAGGE